MACEQGPCNLWVYYARVLVTFKNTSFHDEMPCMWGNDRGMRWSNLKKVHMSWDLIAPMYEGWMPGIL